MQKISGYIYKDDKIYELQAKSSEIDIAMLGNWLSSWVQPNGAISFLQQDGKVKLMLHHVQLGTPTISST